MGSVDQTKENLFEMYTRLIANKDAEIEALQANIYKQRAANDRMERENAEFEPAIETSKFKYNIPDHKTAETIISLPFFFRLAEITLTDQERQFFKKMVSINSRIDIAAPLNKTKKVETVIRAESEFSKEVKVQAAKSGTNVSVNSNRRFVQRNYYFSQLV